MTALPSDTVTFDGAAAIHKPLDDVGRTRLYFKRPTTLSAFLDGCRFLEDDLHRSQASRWSARALVTNTAPSADLRRALSVDVPIEINRLPTVVNGQSLEYLWVSRNSTDRMPAPADREAFAVAVDRCLAFQDNLSPRFGDDIGTALDRARDAGLSVVCNDPFDEWGESGVDADCFTRLVGQTFFVAAPDAALLLQGRGYSHLWHYLFGLRDAAGELMCVFILAKWPWGFEATYTITNTGYRGRPLVGIGAARLLMFVASALVLSRHGQHTLLYGEANTANCRPCVQAGYEIHAPRLGVPDPLVHENVVWADNPLGAPGTSSKPPHHAEAPYASYVLMSLNPRKIAPHIDRAVALLRP